MTSKALTINTIPLEIVTKILNKLSPFDRLSTRKVSKSLRAAVDNIGIHFEYICFKICSTKRLTISLNGLDILYKGLNEDCRITCRNQKKLLQNSNFEEVAFNDLYIFLKHPMNFLCLEDDPFYEEQLLGAFLFRYLPGSLRVKELKLVRLYFEEIVEILQYFAANLLERVILNHPTEGDGIEDLFQLEQFQKSRDFYMESYAFDTTKTSINQFFHFKRFKIKVDKLLKEDAIKCRDDLLKRDTFNYCAMNFDENCSDPVEFAKVFQPEYSGEDVYKLSYQNFKITCNCYGRSERWCIEIERIAV